jgi:predicted anti-sigma-YlaC factor YlaD
MEEPMTCEECKLRASAWFDGEEDGQTFVRILQHLSGCASCSSFLGALPRQSSLLRDCREEYQNIHTEGSDHVPIETETSFFTSYVRAPLAAAAAIILVVISLALEHGLSNQTAAAGDWGGATPVAREKVMR